MLIIFAILLSLICNVGLYAMAFVFVIQFDEPLGFALLVCAVIYSYMLMILREASNV